MFYPIFKFRFIKEIIGFVNLMIVVIEHLPQELRDRFTEMREMDLGVQSL
jgi:hypothetical protein